MMPYRRRKSWPVKHEIKGVRVSYTTSISRACAKNPMKGFDQCCKVSREFGRHCGWRHQSINKLCSHWKPDTFARKHVYVTFHSALCLLLLVLYMYTGLALHDDVIQWKHFPSYWPFVWGIHRSPVNIPRKGQWRGALMFSLICAWTNAWANNREAGDLRRHRAHYDVIMTSL